VVEHVVELGCQLVDVLVVDGDEAVLRRRISWVISSPSCSRSLMRRAFAGASANSVISSYRTCAAVSMLVA
jgi:hypothetical protein